MTQTASSTPKRIELLEGGPNGTTRVIPNVVSIERDETGLQVTTTDGKTLVFRGGAHIMSMEDADPEEVDG